MSLTTNSARAPYEALGAMVELLGQFVECIAETRSDPYLRLSWLRARIEEEQAKFATDWHTAAVRKITRERLEALMTRQIESSNASGIRFVKPIMLGGDDETPLEQIEADTYAAMFGGGVGVVYKEKGE